MIRYLLLFLFFIMFAGGPLGLDVSIAPGLSVKNLFLYLLFIMFVIQTVVARNRKLEALLVLTPYILLLAYCVFSIAVIVFIVNYPNYDLIEGAIQLKSGLADNFLMLLVFFYGVTKIKDAIWLIKMIVWLIMLGNILTLADAFGFPDLAMIDIHYSGRIAGFDGQPNGFGAFLAFFLPATLSLFIYENGLRRGLAGIGVIATFACLILTFSRASYVGVIAGSLIAVVLLRAHVSLRAVTAVSVATIFACAIIIPLMIISGYGDIFIERFSLLGGDAHTVSQGRTTLWLQSINVMMENPVTFITGYGWNAYANFREFRLITHNTYLHYLFNIGVIGLAFFVSTLSGVLVELRRAVGAMSDDKRSFVMSASFGFSAYCIAMFFSEIFRAGPLIWAYIGLVLRLGIASVIDVAIDAGSPVRQKIRPGKI